MAKSEKAGNRQQNIQKSTDHPRVEPPETRCVDGERTAGKDGKQRGGKVGGHDHQRLRDIQAERHPAQQRVKRQRHSEIERFSGREDLGLVAVCLFLIQLDLQDEDCPAAVKREQTAGRMAKRPLERALEKRI